MKKIWISCIVFVALAACNNDSASKTDAKDAKPAESSLSNNPDYQKGLELIANSDCLTCHKVDEAYTGPTYRDVANKYASQAPGIIPELAGKIVKGGSGVWGQVPMTAHPAISQADAEAMVKYILLLKK